MNGCDCTVCAPVRDCAVHVAQRHWIGDELDRYLTSEANRHPTRLRLFGVCERGRGIVMESFGTSLHTLIQRREPLALVPLATALCRALAITEQIGDSFALRSNTTLHCVRVASFNTVAPTVKLVYPMTPAPDGVAEETAMLRHSDDVFRLLAPETAKNRAYGETCCVWLFGVLCRQLALGEVVPCAEMSPVQFVTQLCYGRLELNGRNTMVWLQQAPGVIRHIVAQCLHKRASARPTFATILAWLGARQTLCTVSIALQSRELPALLTLMIGDQLVVGGDVDDAFLPIHVRYGIVCAVKHFKERKI